jgi:5-formyltetrahydrofolate cyclo-ligase
MSESVCRQIIALPEFAASKQILVYHSIPKEVQTGNFIENIKNGKEIFLPVIEENHLSVKKYTGKENGGKRGIFGIWEPAGEACLDYRSIDMIIVPGVAFDRKCNRLGRGKGYYDRLLPSFPNSTLKIGICFDFQLVDSIPTDPFDIPMDMVITEKENIKINRKPILKSE